MSTTTNVTEFSDGTSMVTTETSETVLLDENGKEIDLEAEVIEPVETVEEVTDAAVAIAEIEAERDITIAAIHADVETTAIEARAEEVEQSEWQRNIESQLAETNSRLVEVTTALALLIPPQSQQSEASQLETSPEPESAAQTQDSLEPEAAEERAPEPPKRPKKSRWI